MKFLHDEKCSIVFYIEVENLKVSTKLANNVPSSPVFLIVGLCMKQCIYTCTSCLGLEVQTET